MARTKTGLDYFPLDIDFFEDDKIRGVSARHGMLSEAIALRLLCKIYKGDGYIAWNNSTKTLFFNSINEKFRITTLHKIVLDFINCGLFNKPMYDKYQILTSNGIQRRYINICRQLHKQMCIPEMYLIAVGKNGSQHEAGSKPDDTHPPTKEKKLKEKKLNEIKRPAEDRPDKNLENGIDFTEEGRKLYRAVYGDK